MSLYQFTNGHAFLDSIGVPKLEVYENNVVIERHDFAEQEANGEMEWREDGVYINIDGQYRRGFLYNKDYFVKPYGKMPKFHMAKCTTLQSFEANRTLHTRYYWSNSPTVLVTQRRGSEKYPDTILDVCRNCVDLVSSETISRASTTNSEFKQEQEEIIPTAETNINGRPMNWPAISRRYREKMNYTCEKCGTGGDDLKQARHRRYIDADHIKANELTNTSDANLQCLCVLCHSFKDALHEEKLAKPHILLRLRNFVDDYADVLLVKNSQLLSKFRAKY